MGHKIFVSYKYNDTNVENLSYLLGTTAVHDYVDYIQNRILNGDDIYKGEKAMKIFQIGVTMQFGNT